MENNNMLSIVNACEGLNLLSEEDEGEEHAHGDAHEDAAEEHIHGDTEDTHEDGHNHGDVNAHAWMSIALYKQQVENILEGLCRIDPKHQDAYESNAKEYLAKVEDLEREQQSLKEELAGKHIVIFHEAYAYVAEECKIMQTDYNTYEGLRAILEKETPILIRRFVRCIEN